MVGIKGVMMYESIAEIKSANESVGHKFFRNEWYCQVADPNVYHGIYFITKESLNIGTIKVPESFTIRVINPDKTIGTYGNVGDYKTLAQAQDSMKGIK